MAAPPLGIPSSDNCVNVQIINTTAHMKLPLGLFAHPPKVGDQGFLIGGAYCFLIENPRTKQRVFFDLGTRKDYENYAPVLLHGRLKPFTVFIDVKKNVGDIVQEQGVDLSSVDSIIWSHHHFDHIGNPGMFPPTTELVVGPGFKKGLTPGYPANPDAIILESDYSGRELREINFDASDDMLEIGGLQAYDFFGDGSFYLLNTPGHAIGHMSGLARTTPDTFMFVGGDICHHPGNFRPTEMNPLPEEIVPNPYDFNSCIPCPCSIFMDIHPKHSRTEPFMVIAPSDEGKSAYLDSHEAHRSLDKMKPFDADDRVFVIIAHETTIHGIVDEFPLSANQWREKGWKQKARWRFLSQLKEKGQENGKA